MNIKHRVIESGEMVGGIKILGRVYNAKRKEWEYECSCGVCGKEWVARKDHLLKPRVGCRACSSRSAALARSSKRKGESVGESDKASSIINNI